MGQPVTHKKFVFNEKIDSGFLFSLYGDDYPYVYEVFTDSLEELENALMNFAIAYHAGEVAGLKKAAHRIKPLFGFTGLLSTQDALGNFENLCGSVSQVELLSHQYETVMEQVNESRQILISEQKRLRDHLEN